MKYSDDRSKYYYTSDNSSTYSTVKRSSKKKKGNFLLIPLYLTLGLLGVVIALYVGKEVISRKSLSNVQARARKVTTTNANKAVTKPKEILPRFKALAKQNPDLVGWLTIPDTVVDYPVMFLENDNDFYLGHNFEKNDDINGLLVLDNRCTDKGDGINSLIHGHNMKSGAMFAALLKYRDQKFYETHKVITFSTLYEERNFEVLGVFRGKVNNETEQDFHFYDYINIETKEAFDSYVQAVKNRSLYDTGVLAEYGDKLITLSTCESADENGRLIVVGRSKK